MRAYSTRNNGARVWNVIANNIASTEKSTDTRTHTREPSGARRACRTKSYIIWSRPFLLWPWVPPCVVSKLTATQADLDMLRRERRRAHARTCMIHAQQTHSHWLCRQTHNRECRCDCCVCVLFADIAAAGCDWCDRTGRARYEVALLLSAFSSLTLLVGVRRIGRDQHTHTHSHHRSACAPGLDAVPLAYAHIIRC